MGKILNKILFWTSDFPIVEIISASKLEFFKIKNLTELSNYKGRLYQYDNGNYLLEFNYNGDDQFIEFK